MSHARITVLGNIGQDPESRYTPNGKLVVSFSLAVNPRRRPGDTEDPAPVWYRVSAWNDLAERLDKLAQAGHIAKGRMLQVYGSFEPREYKANNGETRISFDVTANDFDFVGGTQQQGQATQATRPAQGPVNNDYPNDLDAVPF